MVCLSDGRGVGVCDGLDGKGEGGGYTKARIGIDKRRDI